ncbi:MAG TPA: sulfur reduction protein DsrE [Nitrospirae bacterium]|nr:DsrE/DsrF-like family protein [bacterium BMS3Abin10]GBE37638.1 DsrE/DsrF-like family protein [bacterium BMS3Bbin08]HDH50718.1 sulfur reduction protein DsrE [Nitrospirota bacterium]HDK16834.1 sulfur reduction protein DsrE [Nitrospirota bacterium]HDK81708.1 sulfur reduction protein DsrE [Nitrospirota bacterium]
MGKFTIGCFASLVGSMNLDFAVKLAGAAMEKGHKVDLWVSGNATMISIKGQRAFKDYSSLEKPLKELMDKGLNVTACEACAEARGYTKDNTMEGVKRHSMDWYLASAFDADRVLHIGGE